MLRMRLVVRVAMLATVLFVAAPVYADPITINWSLDITRKYDYRAGAYDPLFVAVTGHASTTFDGVPTSTFDYGTTTITTFGGQFGTKWVSPITPLIGLDPFGSGLASPQGSVTFFDTNDHVQAFVEDAAFKAYAYSPQGTQFWSYDAEIRAMQYSPSRGGTGTADYAATTETLTAFYQEFMASGQRAYFYEGYQLFDESTQSSLGGYIWQGSATVISVTTNVNTPIPEPTVLSLVAAGLLCAAGRRRRRY